MIVLIFFRCFSVITAFIPLVLFCTGSCNPSTRHTVHLDSYIEEKSNKYLDYVEKKSNKQPAKKLLVWLHGTTQNGGSALGTFPAIQQELPDCHIESVAIDF